MIIKCPECGREISDKAASCPNCGCPSSAWMAKKKEFPFRIVSYDQNNVIVACKKCGCEVEYSRNDVLIQGERALFPRGMRCPDCKTDIPRGSYCHIGHNLSGNSIDLSSPETDASDRARANSEVQWNYGNRNIDFSIRAFSPGATRSYLVCEGCGTETAVSLMDFEKRGEFYMAKKAGQCPTCRKTWGAGDIFQERSNLGWAPPSPKADKTNLLAASQEKHVGGLKLFLIVILVLGIIGSIVKAYDNRQSSRYSSGSSYNSGSYSSSARRPTSTLKPASDQFGDDAEELMKDAKSAFGNEAAVSWTVNGKKVTLTVRIKDISSDDIAEWFRTDPAWAQDMIDDLAGSMKDANKSTYDALKNKGHSGFTVVFEMQTSDYFTVCTASNGSLTYKMTQENFKYG